MKRIIIVSDTPEKLVCFSTAKRSKSVEIDFSDSCDWSSLLERRGIMLYLDLSSFSKREARRVVNILEGQEGLSYGIIDPEGFIPDPADLFHGGASDYIGPALFGGKLTLNRVLQGMDFYPGGEDDDAPEVYDDALSWDDIEEGGEYPFFFLYAELDILPEWKAESASSMISGLLHTFESHLNRVFAPLGGRLWMKSDYGGLYLFPYSSGQSGIISACLQLILNKVLTSTEIFSYGTLLPYHFALDKGHTVYRKKGETGTLISDAVNFIFHLGQQYTTEGNFILSSRMAEHIPRGLEDCFTENGEFADQPLLRMKLPK